MTVRDLIRELSALEDQDMEVVREDQGYNSRLLPEVTSVYTEWQDDCAEKKVVIR